jgi:hypothetical protein
MSEMPFIHEDRCRHQDHEPEWQVDSSMGVERGQCGCGTESRPLAAWRIDAASASPEPARSAALHDPGCSRAVDAVTVERNTIDGGWLSLCGLCGCKTLFWREDMWETPTGDPRDAVLQGRAGNTLYVYRTVDDERREQQRGQRPRVIAGLRRG